MSDHYGDDYDYEEKLQQKKTAKACKELLKLTEELRTEIRHNRAEVPERFVDSLEDLSNWLETRIRNARNKY